MIYAEVIGDPIEQSKSPIIHAQWLETTGIEADYRRTQVAEADVTTHFTARLADPDWRGSNVTMPDKYAALEAAAHKSDLAIAARAANMVVPRDGALAAGNSDVGAILAVLRSLYEEQRPMDHVALYGTGGAARAVLVATRAISLDAITIHARDLQKARALAVEFGLSRQPVALDVPPRSDGVVNATPLGMVGKQCLNCDVSGLPDDGWVFDMVTAPVETKLVLQARARGLAIRDGIEMLVEQAAASFEAFFGQPPNRERDVQLYAMLRE